MTESSENTRSLSLNARQRVDLGRHALATTIERQTIEWIKQVIGFEGAAGGLFVNGGSMANLVGVAAALAARHPTIAHDGVRTLTRRFRALKVWMTLRCHGTRALGEAIERNITLARRLGDLVDRDPDLERLAPVPLSIVCFRYLRKTDRAKLQDPDVRQRHEAQDEVNRLNRQLMVAMQTGGEAYLSNTMIGDAFALRACIVNYRTTEEDLVQLLDEVKAAAHRM